MNLIGAFVLCLATCSAASWMDDLKSPEGLEIWNGLSVQLTDSMDLTASPLERYSLKVNYSGLGLTVQKDPKKDAMQIGILTTDRVEGKRLKPGVRD